MSINREEFSPEKRDNMIEKEFVAEQLVKISAAMDLSDNAGSLPNVAFFKKTLLLNYSY